MKEVYINCKNRNAIYSIKEVKAGEKANKIYFGQMNHVNGLLPWYHLHKIRGNEKLHKNVLYTTAIYFIAEVNTSYLGMVLYISNRQILIQFIRKPV